MFLRCLVVLLHSVHRYHRSRGIGSGRYSGAQGLSRRAWRMITEMSDGNIMSSTGSVLRCFFLEYYVLGS